MSQNRALLEREVAHNRLLLRFLREEISREEYEREKGEIYRKPLRRTQTVYVRRSTNPADYAMPLDTLQGALDNFLSLPQITISRNGNVIVRTSRKLIERGEVQVNGFARMDSNFTVKAGDQLHWGYRTLVLKW